MTVETKIQQPGTSLKYEVDLRGAELVALARAQNDSEAPFSKIIGNSIKLGLIVLADAPIYVRRNGIDRRVVLTPQQDVDEFGFTTIDPDAALEELGITLKSMIDPATDVKDLLESWSREKPVHESRDLKLQDMAQREVRRAAMSLIDRFGRYFTDEQLLKLERIHEGVAVVQNLTKHISNLSSILDIPKIQIPDQIMRFVCAIHGSVSLPFVAIVFDEAHLKSRRIERRKSKIDRSQTITHESVHIIGDGNMPMLLDEVATDDFADQINGQNSHSRERMTIGFRYIWDIWQWIKGQVDEETLLSAYTQPAVVEMTVDDKTDKVVSSRYLDHPFHDQMRDLLGEGRDGQPKWDEVIDLIGHKKGRQAYELMFPSRNKWEQFTRYLG